MNLNSVKLTPAFKDYLWGGEKLKTDFNKHTSLYPLAESWELSMHKDGESKTEDGIPLSQYVTREMLGSNALEFDYFPILIKFIDAKSALSVQVHPDDSYALKNEGEYGKTEMWYVLDAEKNAFLYYGFKKDITKDEYRTAIEDGTLTELLNKVPVKKGDVFFIPAGTVHAIGAGIVICEIQQNSNTTYRVYDYGRRDKDGNTRPLHIKKAIEVSSLTKAELTSVTGDTLASCEYFTVKRLYGGKYRIDKTSFHSLTVTDGTGKLLMNGAVTKLTKGDSIFIPAQNGSYEIKGGCEIILSYI